MVGVAEPLRARSIRPSLSVMERRLSALSAAIVASIALCACSPSAPALEGRAGDLPGVVEVSAVEMDVGDDDIPFATVAKLVTVTMDAEATASQVMAVFEAYGDDIDDGDVGSVEVLIEGPKQATLATGEDVHVTKAAVEDLVAAQSDDAVTAYRWEAYPVLPSVSLELESGDFADVVAAADRYRGVDELESTSVVADEFALVRDEVNDDMSLTAAREAFVLEVAPRFRLRGALVSGRGPLLLAAAPADQRALRQLVKRTAAARGIGQVEVGSDAEPDI